MNTTTTTTTAGMQMPAEWAPHERTLIAWPAREAAWRGEATIEQARDAHAQVVAAVAAFEPVTLVVDPAHEEDARRRVTGENVELVVLAIDDSWLRDSGPIVVLGRDAEGRPSRAGVDFRFNAWGEAFSPYDADDAIAAGLLDHLGIARVASSFVLEGGSIAVDGAGTLLTTEQCNLNRNRNPDATRGQVEDELRAKLGIERVVWLGQGLVEDADTDGHVDNVAAFLPDGRVLLQTVADADDPNFAHAAENRARLEAAGLEVVDFELLPRTARDGEPVAVPYMNFYLCNGAAIVPCAQLAPEMDAEALERLRALLPGREVVGVPGRVLALGGGGVHCITQQVPALPEG
jgi:agmatine deiminase